MKQSKLILVDGISGSGKDTQMGFIERFFAGHGYAVHTVHEPSDFLGDVCRQYRNRPFKERDGHVEAMLFAADRREHYVRHVKPLLAQEGNVVLSNRSFVASAAYQSLQGVPLDDILRLNEFYPEPDLALVFLCDPQEAVRRIERRALETGKPVSAQENPERIAAIHGSYRSLVSTIMQMRVVNTDGHPLAVEHQLRSHLNKVVNVPMGRAVFLDKDGTLVDNSGYPEVIPTNEIYLDKTVPGLRDLQEAGYKFFIISSQPWVARGRMTVDEVENVFKNVVKTYLSHGIRIDGYGFCPHARTEGCRCKKPDTLLLEGFASQYCIDTASSFFVGDMDDDIKTGQRFGLRTAFVSTGKGNAQERIFAQENADYVCQDVNDFARQILR